VILVPRIKRFAPTVEGRHLAIAVAVGFVLRLAWGLYAMRNVPHDWVAQGDQYSYWYYGNEMAHFRGYIGYETGSATSYYPVGFPVLLAIVYWLGLHTPLPNDQPLLTMGLQLLLSVLSIVLVYFIARKVFNHRVAIIGAWIVALFPSLIAGVGTYSLETAFIFSMLLCVAILLDHDWTRPMSRRRLLWFGVALGCSVLIRPFSAPVMIGLAVAVWVATRSWRSVLRHVGWAAVTFVLVLTPWTIRNEVRFDHFIPISTNLGDGLCMSRYPGSNGGFAWSTHQWCADSSLPEAERNPANTKAAIRFVLNHPTEELRQIPKRFVLMMKVDHTAFDESLGNGSNVSMPAGPRDALNLWTDIYFHLSWIVSLVGVGLLFSGWRKDVIHGPRKAVVAMATLGLLIVPVMLWGNPRFHTPLLPFLAILDGATVDWLLRRWGSRAEQPVTAPADVPPEMARIS
jgi:4-amino-4-deoxy-L-arabinose transferase-like glycosyltransferase